MKGDPPEGAKGKQIDPPRQDRPPSLAAFLLSKALPSDERENVLGDLEQAWYEESTGSRTADRLWYWAQALLMALGFLGYRVQRSLSEPRKTSSLGDPNHALASPPPPLHLRSKGDSAMSGWFQDFRFAFRIFARRPGFAISTVLILALGIGASTAVFSLVDSILLRPLPFHDPDRLTAISEREIRRDAESGEVRLYSPYPYFTHPAFQYWTESQDLFESLGAYGDIRRILKAGDASEQVRGAVVSASLFPTLGVGPVLGRGFRDEEDEEGSAGVIILSHELWATRFQEDQDPLGQSITVDEEPFTVIGVMPPWFSFPDPEVLYWIPLATASRDPNSSYLQMVGRLPKGLDPETASSRASTLERSGGPGDDPPSLLHISPLKDQVIGSNVQRLLAILTAAVGGVLLIVCTNVASLLLSGATSRRGEIAVRAALGAGRRRLARQLLAESMALCLLGAVAGIGLASVLIKGLLWLSPALLPRQGEIGIHLGVLGFSVGLALFVSLLVGVGPALKWSRPGLAWSPQGPRGATRGRGEGRFQDLLVAAQVAMALALVVGAGLLTHSFVRQWTNPSGFSAADRVLVAELALPGLQAHGGLGRFAEEEARLEFYGTLLQRVKADPSVRSASLTSRLPFSNGRAELPIQIEGLAIDEGIRRTTRLFVIAPEYFSTMGVGILKGREFDSRDTNPDDPGIIIDQTLVDRFFQGADPFGRRIRFRDDQPWYTVVGIVAPTRHLSLTEDHVPQAFLNVAQGERGLTFGSMTVLVGTRGRPTSAAPGIRSAVADLDPGVAVSSLTPLQSRILGSVGEARYVGLLVGFFGFVALVLASVGVYALVAHSVERRSREMGVRLALGAKPLEIVREVTHRSLCVTGVGVAAGSLGSFWAVGFLQSLLFGVSARNLPTFGVAVALLAASAALASLIPALRATRLDPVKVLTED